jgi:hypothetical protein
VANTNNTIKNAPGIIAKAAAQTLKDNLKFTSSIDQADASDYDGKNGYKAGDTIKVSVPARYIPQNTLDITSSIQDNVEEKRDLPLDISSTVGMQFGSIELATEVDLKNIINRYVIPAAESIAQDVERRMLQKATQATYNLTGTAGSNSFTVADVLAGKTVMDMALAPQDGNREFLLNSASGAKAVVDRKGLFQSSTEIDKQYKNGLIGRADGFDWMSNELIYTHTNGADVTGVALTAQPTTGASTIAVNGLTASTTGIVKKGSVFTIAGVNKVHPITKVDTGVLQQFVVTADADSDGSGATTLSISPTIYTSTSKGLQNIAALPTSTAALTFSGAASTSYAQNLQFHKSAFRMVSVPLEMPTAVEWAAQETVDGLTIQVVRSFDVLQRRMITRLDFLGGLVAVRPEWANRVTA